jgi:hypothetical protein
MPAEQLAAVFARIRANTTTATEERERALLAEAGCRDAVNGQAVARRARHSPDRP